jgi:HTH-type transcriptional regulator/antitoxin HigA
MIEPVVDSSSHKKALRRLEKLWDAKPGSRQERELDALATLVDAYERRAFLIDALAPVEAITLRCEQLGWSRKELKPLIGSRVRVSEVLTGRRPLTLPMIRSLHKTLPARSLLGAGFRWDRAGVPRGPARLQWAEHCSGFVDCVRCCCCARSGCVVARRASSARHQLAGLVLLLTSEAPGHAHSTKKSTTASASRCQD